MGRRMHSGYDSVTEHETAIRLSLPRLDGQIVAPRYWPKQRWAERDREFLAWCDKHPRKDWPDWLESFIDEHALRKGGAVNVAEPGRRVLESGADASARPGRDVGPGRGDGAEVNGET
jgi:hypothetical protein